MTDFSAVCSNLADFLAENCVDFQLIFFELFSWFSAELKFAWHLKNIQFYQWHDEWLASQFAKCISYPTLQRIFKIVYIEDWKKCGILDMVATAKIVMSSHLRHFCPYHQSLSRKNLFFSKRFSSSLEFLALTQIFPCFSICLSILHSKNASEASVAIY